jgi:chromate transporter
MHVLFARVGELKLGWFSPAWPELASLDWRAALLAAVAVVALFIARIGMVPTLAVCAAGGLLLHAAGF